MRALGRRASLRAVLSRLVVGLALVLGVLIIVAMLSTLSTARDYRDSSQQAIARQGAAQRVLVDMLNAQGANRAYIFLGRGSDRAAWNAARARIPANMTSLRRSLAGDPDLLSQADAVDRTIEMWLAEAVQLIGLRSRGEVDAARDRADTGVGEPRFESFRREHSGLLSSIEAERRADLRANDRRLQLTLVGIVVAALLALGMVAVVSRQVWRRVGGPINLVSDGVQRVTQGDLASPVPTNREAVRELVGLVDAFNLMQREVREERLAVAASARREAVQRTERQLWETVQQGLLPSRLPAVPGLRLAARYRPSERSLLVGGDFYDAMLLDDGRLAVMVGDMAGHGAAAAAQAAALRFGWRTLVAVDPDPAAVLSALNTQMGTPEQRAEGLFASAIHMLLRADGHLEFALAGHPAPFLLTADGCNEVDPPRPGPLLGVIDRAEWPVAEAQLPAGGTIVLYTDGLIEARRDADIFGGERARAVLVRERRAALELRVRRLIDAARRHEDERLRDDVVVLAIERPGGLPWAVEGPAQPPDGVSWSVQRV